VTAVEACWAAAAVAGAAIEFRFYGRPGPARRRVQVGAGVRVGRIRFAIIPAVRRSPMPPRRAALRSRSTLARRAITTTATTSAYEAEFRRMRPQIIARAGGACEARFATDCTGRTGPSSPVHHRKLRTQGGPNSDVNLMAVCVPCHAEIHARPPRSRRAGMLVPSWADPAEIPIVPGVS
jgi:hypothetical protein